MGGEEAVEKLRRWVAQQKKAGVSRVVADPGYRLEGFMREKPGAQTEAVPSARAAAASPAPAPAVGISPILADRHPAWAGTELLPLAAEIDECSACGLAATRGNSVPGVGNPRARLVFIGEAPGAEEDRQGIPFVGRAGQLLDKILAAIDLSREDVHILNILKCRPPENRNPAPDEILACRLFLERQLAIIEPKIIVALGLFASQWLTGKKVSLTKLRQSGPHEYHGIPVWATYHPAALLRNPNWKKPAWEDFQAIQKEYESCDS